MAHLRKYSSMTGSSRSAVHFDPKCVDGITSEQKSSIIQMIRIHLISDGEYLVDISGNRDAVDTWIQENIVAIAGENPDTSGC